MKCCSLLLFPLPSRSAPRLAPSAHGVLVGHGEKVSLVQVELRASQSETKRSLRERNSERNEFFWFLKHFKRNMLKAGKSPMQATRFMYLIDKSQHFKQLRNCCYQDFTKFSLRPSYSTISSKRSACSARRAMKTHSSRVPDMAQPFDWF